MAWIERRADYVGMLATVNECNFHFKMVLERVGVANKSTKTAIEMQENCRNLTLEEEL